MKEFLSLLTRREFLRRFPGVLLVGGESKDVEQDGRLDEHERRLRDLENTQKRMGNALLYNAEVDALLYDDQNIKIHGVEKRLDDLTCDVHPGSVLCPEEDALSEE